MSFGFGFWIRLKFFAGCYSSTLQPLVSSLTLFPTVLLTTPANHSWLFTHFLRFFGWNSPQAGSSGARIIFWGYRLQGDVNSPYFLGSSAFPPNILASSRRNLQSLHFIFCVFSALWRFFHHRSLSRRCWCLGSHLPFAGLFFETYGRFFWFFSYSFFAFFLRYS